MDGNPAPPTPDRRGTAEPRPESRGSQDGACGPLAVRRMTKDDGRALIVYERVDPRGQPDSGEPGRRRART